MKRVVVLGFVALLGCASMKSVVAPSRDYHDYRAYRLANGLGERLATGWHYLRHHPDGVYRDEVAAWFWPAETRFWNEAGRTPGGAKAYLELMPDGPHAEEESTFLRAFELERVEGPRRAQRALEAAKKKAEAARRAYGEAIEAWAKRAAVVKELRVPRADLAQTELGKLYDAPPSPICDPDGCSKFLTFSYPVPEATTAIDRVVVLDVRLEITAGLVTAISLALPKHGFTWWLEGSEARGIDPDDPALRNEAIVRARNRIEKVVREARGSTCSTTEADQARVIACDDLRVAIGTLPNGDDVIRFVVLGATSK